MAKKNILHRSKLKKAKKLLADKKLDEADKILSVLAIQSPRDADVWLCLGYIAGTRQDYEKAGNCFKKALAIEPDNAKTLFNYGIALRDAGKFSEALEVFQKAFEKNPENTEILDCLAHACMNLGRLDEAQQAFSQSLVINPAQAETHSNLGSIYQAKGELSRAEACYREAVRLDPQIDIADNLGSVLISQGRYNESVDVYRAGLDKQPLNTRVFSNLLLGLNYMGDITQRAIYEEHRKWSDTFERPANYIAHELPARNHDKIRVGYYSPDFREHSVAYFIEPVIEHHDREKFITYAYYPSQKEDAVTRRLQDKFDNWRNISMMTVNEVADLVTTDEIDILVDLAGHTANNMLLLFANKPAPVQITYLGYPNTTGLKAIQYRLTDVIADPEGQDEYYSEALCRLPECFLTYRPDENAPNVSKPPVIQNSYITFGSFNNLAKINDKVITAWSKLLGRVSDSRLLIKNPSLTDKKTRQRYIDKFSQKGIEAGRIELLGHTPTRHEHLSLYNCIDISLDTFPYNGTTTTCEALWMGVPVISMCGTQHAARVSASLLSAAGRREWIAYSEEEYIEKAALLAENTQVLLTTRLRQREHLLQSTLLDARGFTSSLESEYQKIWQTAHQ